MEPSSPYSKCVYGLNTLTLTLVTLNTQTLKKDDVICTGIVIDNQWINERRNKTKNKYNITNTRPNYLELANRYILLDNNEERN